MDFFENINGFPHQTVIDMMLSFNLNDYTSVHRDGNCYGEEKKT